jgi:hypothetical protein
MNQNKIVQSFTWATLFLLAENKRDLLYPLGISVNHIGRPNSFDLIPTQWSKILDSLFLQSFVVNYNHRNVWNNIAITHSFHLSVSIIHWWNSSKTRLNPIRNSSKGLQTNLLWCDSKTNCSEFSICISLGGMWNYFSGFVRFDVGLQLYYGTYEYLQNTTNLMYEGIWEIASLVLVSCRRYSKTNDNCFSKSWN